MSTAPSMNLHVSEAMKLEGDRLAPLRVLATADNPEGCFALGLALLKENRPDSRIQAHYYVGQAAAKGFEPARLKVRDWKISGDLEFENDEEAIDLLEEAISEGSNEARYQLGVRLTQGKGISADPERVAELYSQAAAEGHVPSMFGLGSCYQNGYGIEQDEDEAVRWLTAAADQDYPEAIYGLGVVHSANGDDDIAVDYWKRAAELGDVRSLMALARAYATSEGVERDADKMRLYTLRAAKAGLAEAQYRIGNYYRFGEPDFEQDFETAFAWYSLAARQEHPQATYSTGLHTILGHGVEQDVQKGWDLIESAAKMDCVDAMMGMGVMIDSGQAPIDDPEMALYWYQQAADKGHAEAQLMTGKRLLAIPNEKRFARDYLLSAAEQGMEEAQQLLDALDVEEPPAPPPQPQDSLNPALTGNPQAQFQLGFAHYMGLGVAHSFAQSYFWMAVASKKMPEQTVQMLGMLATQLDPAVKEKLDQAAAKWTPGTSAPTEQSY